MTSPYMLKDQEYMELVFENGQILAKCQRSNYFSLKNQRTESIVDLYEAEYNEDFKKSIHGGGKFIKNLGFTEHHDVVADGTNIVESYKHVDELPLRASSSKRLMVDYEKRKKIEFIPPDEQSMVAEKSVELNFTYSSTDLSEDSEGSTYLSSSLDDESDGDDMRPRVPVRRRRKALVRTKRTAALERKQRNDINKKMRTLQDLLPNFHEDDKETLLDETISYMSTLQHQVEMMKMGNSYVTPAMILPHYSQMGLQMSIPQFVPAPVPGAGLTGITDAANMLRFLDHPGLVPMQNLLRFSPMENYFPQSVPPSCVASPNHIPNSSRNQGTLRDGGIFSGQHS